MNIKIKLDHYEVKPQYIEGHKNAAVRKYTHKIKKNCHTIGGHTKSL